MQIIYPINFKNFIFFMKKIKNYEIEFYQKIFFIFFVGVFPWIIAFFCIANPEEITTFQAYTFGLLSVITNFLLKQILTQSIFYCVFLYKNPDFVINFIGKRLFV